MRFCVLVLFLWLTLPALAQENKVEVFGGYQYTRFTGDNFNGWNAAVTGNLNSWLGIIADVSGAYRSPIQNTPSRVTNIQISSHQYNLVFGPTVAYRKDQRIKPYAHALLGLSHLSSTGTFALTTGGTSSISDSVSTFAMALGGGVDLDVNKRIAIRVLQAD